MLKQTMACAAMVALLACGDDDVVGGSGGTSAGTGGVGAISGSGGAAGTGGVGGTAGVSGTGGSGGVSGSAGTGATGGTGGTAGVASTLPRNRIDTRDRLVCAIGAADDQAECWNASGGSPGPILSQLGPLKQFQYDSDECWLSLDGLPHCDFVGDADPAPAVEMRDIAFTDQTFPVACGVALDGMIHCWNATLELPAISGVSVLDVSGGEGGVCRVLAADGALQCSKYSDTAAEDGLPGVFVQAASGKTHIAGLRADGSVVYRDVNGAPIPPKERPGPYVQVAAGWDFLCGIRPDGEAECWADNADDAALIEAPPPGPYEELAMDRYACGIRSRGDVVCWRGPSAVEAFAAPPQGFVAKTGP
jgi:hypothetical protein